VLLERSERSKGVAAEVVAGRKFRAKKKGPGYPAARHSPTKSYVDNLRAHGRPPVLKHRNYRGLAGFGNRASRRRINSTALSIASRNAFSLDTRSDVWIRSRTTKDRVTRCACRTVWISRLLRPRYTDDLVKTASPSSPSVLWQPTAIWFWDSVRFQWMIRRQDWIQLPDRSAPTTQMWLSGVVLKGEIDRFNCFL